MKKLIIVGFFFHFILVSKSQNWVLAKNIDIGAQDVGTSVGIDNKNNLYVGGYTAYYSGGGGSHFYPVLCKFSPTGQLLWQDTLSSGSQKSVTDNLGHTYLAGGNIICKYDSLGKMLWKVNVANMFIRDISINPVTGIVAVGEVYGNNAISVIANYDTNGNCLWLKTGTISDDPFHVISDQTGSSYILGSQFTKIDKAGTIINSFSLPNATYNDLAVDYAGNIYFSGWFSIIPFTITGTTYNANGNPDQFLLKYDQTGNLLWYKILKGHMTTRTAIVVDNDASVYFGSSFYQTLSIDSFNISGNSEEAFIINFDSSANIKWLAYSIGDTNQSAGSAQIYDLALDNSGNLLAAGSATFNHKFGNTNLTCSDYSDVLIAKLSLQDVSVIDLVETKNSSFAIYPNPSSGIFTINYSSQEKGGLEVKITNVRGQIIFTESIPHFTAEYAIDIDLSKYAKGIYFVEIIADRKRTIRKVVLD